MKYLILLALFLPAIALYSQSSSPEDKFKKLSWLEGSWIRTQLKPGRAGTERWERLSPTHWIGTGVTLRGIDTAALEKLQLVVKDKELYYVADIPENKAPVFFKLTEIGTSSFTCENPEHDFPRKIQYQYDVTTLKATISGNGKAIDYFFEKSR